MPPSTCLVWVVPHSTDLARNLFSFISGQTHFLGTCSLSPGPGKSSHSVFCWCPILSLVTRHCCNFVLCFVGVSFIDMHSPIRMKLTETESGRGKLLPLCYANGQCFPKGFLALGKTSGAAGQGSELFLLWPMSWQGFQEAVITRKVQSVANVHLHKTSIKYAVLDFSIQCFDSVSVPANISFWCMTWVSSGYCF